MGNQYTFECYPLPWTEIGIGIPNGEIGNCHFDVTVELTDEECLAMKDMTLWASRNEWFDHTTSEMASSELMKKFVPELYERVRSQAKDKFIQKYPNSENVVGFGEFDIYPPDELIADD